MLGIGSRSCGFTALLAKIGIFSVQTSTALAPNFDDGFGGLGLSQSGFLQGILDHTTGHAAVGFEVLAGFGRVEDHAGTGQTSCADPPNERTRDDQTHAAKGAEDIRFGIRLEVGEVAKVQGEGEEGGEEEDAAQDHHAHADVVGGLAFFGDLLGHGFCLFREDSKGGIGGKGNQWAVDRGQWADDG